MRALLQAVCLLALSAQAETARIACYNPGATQTLADLGATEEIVAATRWCPLPKNHPAARICDAFTPDLEALQQTKPSLVILPRLANPLWAEKCRRAGLRVVVLNPEGPESLAKDIRVLGEATGRASRAEALATALERPDERPLRSLLIIWDGMMAGPESYLAQPLKKTGFKSPLPGGSWVKTDWETIASCRPDAILWIGNSSENTPISPSPGRRKEMMEINVIKELKCVKEGKIYQSGSGSDWLPGSGVIRKLGELSTVRGELGP